MSTIHSFKNPDPKTTDYATPAWLQFIWDRKGQAEADGTPDPFDGNPVLGDTPDGGWSETYASGAVLLGSNGKKGAPRYVTITIPADLQHPDPECEGGHSLTDCPQAQKMYDDAAPTDDDLPEQNNEHADGGDVEEPSGDFDDWDKHPHFYPVDALDADDSRPGCDS